jgi:SCAMP family
MHLVYLTAILYGGNVIATIGLTTSNEPAYHSHLGIVLAALYALLCPPLAFYIWHWPLYHALKSDRAVLFLLYFFMFGFQLFFAAFLAIGIFNGGGGGLIGTMDMLSTGHILPAILSLICVLISILFCIVGAFQLKQVAYLYRHGGHTLDKARNDMLQAVAANPHAVQALFTKAADSSV